MALQLKWRNGDFSSSVGRTLFQGFLPDLCGCESIASSWSLASFGQNEIARECHHILQGLKASS